MLRFSGLLYLRSYLRNNLNESSFLHFPTYKKTTKIINLRCLFFMVDSNFYIQLHFFSQQNIYPGFSLNLFETSPQRYLRGPSHRLSSSVRFPSKFNWSLSGCVFFLQLRLFGLLMKVPLESLMGRSEKMNIKCVQLLCWFIVDTSLLCNPCEAGINL